MNYFKKAWKLSGSLNKYQYIRLTSIIWLVGVVYIVGTMLFDNYASLSIVQMILNILEAMLFSVVVILIAYVDVRFFPWAKLWTGQITAFLLPTLRAFH